MYRVHLFISGRVQGVFFRRFVYEEAIKRGIRGWVRNLYDGRVEVLAIHENKETLENLVKKCHQGPQLSQVTKIEQNWDVIDSSDMNYSDFSIESTA